MDGLDAHRYDFLEFWKGIHGQVTEIDKLIERFHKIGFLPDLL